MSKTKGTLQEMTERHYYEINNPKINKEDGLYKDRLILLVSEKSNWHIYYDPKNDYMLSIAVVPSAKSTIFGSKEYFRRWYKYKKRNSKNTMLCLSNTAIKIINKEHD